jgi:hypothetical protein
MSTNGLVVLAVPSRMTWDDWTARVKNVAMVKRKLPFYIGDLLLIGEQTFGERASQFLNEFGYSQGALESFRWVSKKFPPEDRCDLPWGYHQAAAALPKRERDKALTAALAGELNRAGIRALVASNGSGRNGGSSDEKTASTLPDGKSVAAEALGEAIILVGKLLQGRGNEKALSGALDELIDAAMALREKIAG